MSARNDSGQSGWLSPCFLKQAPLKGRTIRLYLNAARYMMFACVWLEVLCVWMKANLRRAWHGGFSASGFLSVALFFASSPGFWKGISISRRLIRITVNISITMIVCTREQSPAFLLLEIWKSKFYFWKFSKMSERYNTRINNCYLFLICDIA